MHDCLLHVQLTYPLAKPIRSVAERRAMQTRTGIGGQGKRVQRSIEAEKSKLPVERFLRARALNFQLRTWCRQKREEPGSYHAPGSSCIGVPSRSSPITNLDFGSNTQILDLFGEDCGRAAVTLIAHSSPARRGHRAGGFFMFCLTLKARLTSGSSRTSHSRLIFARSG
jgi:hypothetical protein